MSEILSAAFSLPTAVFTWLLMPITLYWLVAVLGVFNIDWMEGMEGAAEGAAEHAAESLADGFHHAVSEGVLDVEASLEGAHGALEADGRGGFFKTAGFGDVPRSISWSLIVFFGWLTSLLATLHLPGFQQLTTRGLGVATLLGVASLLVALVATAIAIQPLRRLILAGFGPTRSDLLGTTCTVTTARVDRHFGQAEALEGASILQVRNTGDAVLTRGDQAIIFDFDAEREVYLIAPVRGSAIEP